jgi:hypothetical protein
VIAVAQTSAAAVLAVFAGGPHTPSRCVLATTVLEKAAPAFVVLTGWEFQRRRDEPPVRSLFAALSAVPDVSVRTDQSRTTLESCLLLARELRARFPEGAEVTVVTSNYHAPRVRWLLGGLLSSRYPFKVLISSDIRRSDFSCDATARRLILGEAISWLYCFPVGLLFRPLPTVTAVLLLTLLLRLRGRRSRASGRGRRHA